MKNLTAITPLDGRYNDKIIELSTYVSEFALIKFRIEVEIKYLLALSDCGVMRKLSKKEKDSLNSFYLKFDMKQAKKIKGVENQTKHDVKALEKYLRIYFDKTSLKDISEFIHFGLTSEDVNNIAYRMMLKNSIEHVISPAIEKINDELLKKAKEYKRIVILARTHGQAAVPTTFGKEFLVFHKRLEKEIKKLKKLKLTGKLNGAVGNYNALYFAYPKTNWVNFSKKFTVSFGLEPNLITTQINPFEDVISVFQTLERINGVLLDFNSDTWRYISDGWLKLASKANEVGSSTMPQKINPIDFENSEGNLTLANGLMQTMNDKLYISRLQRDLSNSTVIRNMGTALGYCLLGYKNALTGLSKIDINTEKIEKDINSDYSVLAEGLQTYLRKQGFNNAYYFVMKTTKGKIYNKGSWEKMINRLPIPEEDKKELLKLSPENYIGIADRLIG